MFTSRLILRVLIYSLLVLTFFLGLPQVHYASALMIAILIRHKDEPQGILGPVNSTDISLPFFTEGPGLGPKRHLPKAPATVQVIEQQDSESKL